MTHRRLAPGAVALIAAGALSVPAAVSASTAHPAGTGTGVILGHVAYLTADNRVEVAAINPAGTTDSSTQIGPITAVSGNQTIEIYAIVTSGDGQWIAWQEELAKPSKYGPEPIKLVLVVRNLVDGSIYHLDTGQAPIGFAGDELITSNSSVAKTFSTTPTPQLTTFKKTSFALGAYGGGLVDVDSRQAPSGPDRTDALRLDGLDGTSTVLHRYVLGRTDYRDVDAAWTSPDQQHLVVERGNHQDFGGLGPSSLADEYDLSGSNARSALGHYGTAKAGWRLGGVTFAGGSDKVWAQWERETRAGATSLAATYSHGSWHSQVPKAIAIAGNAEGDVIVQTGKYVATALSEDFVVAPTGDALLRIGGLTKVMSIRGIAFDWVVGPAD